MADFGSYTDWDGAASVPAFPTQQPPPSIGMALQGASMPQLRALLAASRNGTGNIPEPVIKSEMTRRQKGTHVTIGDDLKSLAGSLGGGAYPYSLKPGDTPPPRREEREPIMIGGTNAYPYNMRGSSDPKIAATQDMPPVQALEDVPAYSPPPPRPPLVQPEPPTMRASPGDPSRPMAKSTFGSADDVPAYGNNSMLPRRNITDPRELAPFKSALAWLTQRNENGKGTARRPIPQAAVDVPTSAPPPDNTALGGGGSQYDVNPEGLDQSNGMPAFPPTMTPPEITRGSPQIAAVSGGRGGVRDDGGADRPAQRVAQAAQSGAKVETSDLDAMMKDAMQTAGMLREAPASADKVPKWAMPMMMAGFAMMASKSPTLMGAVGESGILGMQVAAKQMDQEEARKERGLDRSVKGREIELRAREHYNTEKSRRQEHADKLAFDKEKEANQAGVRKAQEASLLAGAEPTYSAINTDKGVVMVPTKKGRGAEPYTLQDEEGTPLHQAWASTGSRGSAMERAAMLNAEKTALAAVGGKDALGNPKQPDLYSKVLKQEFDKAMTRMGGNAAAAGGGTGGLPQTIRNPSTGETATLDPASGRYLNAQGVPIQ